MKQLVKRESLSIVPPALELRKAVEEGLRRIAESTSEREVRRIAEELNETIAATNARATTAPASDVAPLDVEKILERWRAGELPGCSGGARGP